MIVLPTLGHNFMKTNLTVLPGEIAVVQTVNAPGAGLSGGLSLRDTNVLGESYTYQVTYPLRQGDSIIGPADIEMRLNPSNAERGGYAVIRILQLPPVLRATLEHSADGVTWEDAPRGVVAGRDNDMFRVTLRPAQ